MTHRFSSSSGTLNGIFTYVNQVSKIKNEGDLIHLAGMVTFKDGSSLSDFFTPAKKTYIVTTGENCSLTFTFSTISVNITGYSITSDPSVNRALRDWTFEGKNNESNKWELLHSEYNYQGFLNDSPMHFSVNNGVYNSFKLTKLNINNDGTTYFDLHGFDVFGQICNPVNCDILPYFTIIDNNNYILKELALYFCFIGLIMR